MLIFYCLVALMTMIGLFVVIRALLKNVDSQSTNAKQVSLDIYQQHLSELQRDREAGVLSGEQSANVQAELERSLLDEINASINEAVVADPSAKRSKESWAAGFVAILIPLLAGTLYYNLGQPELITSTKDETSQQSGEEMHKNMPSVEEMIAILAQRLLENPEDVKGWSMLSRSYMALGRFQDAVNAYKQLHKLVGDQPDVLVGYADALSMANNRSLAGEPEELIQKALSVDPDNIIGLWLAGRAADEKKQYETAIDYWQHLLPMLKEDPKSETEVKQLINRARENLGISATDQITQVTTRKESPDKSAVSISVDVELDPVLKGNTNPEDTVFIFARASVGPRMPLAIVRKQVKDLPVKVTLDDSMAMSSAMSLSNFKQVVVGARVSKDGNAMPRSGDLSGTSEDIQLGAVTETRIIIDQLIP